MSGLTLPIALFLAKLNTEKPPKRLQYLAPHAERHIPIAGG